MADLDRLYAALKAADAAGNTDDARALAGAIQSASAPAPASDAAPRWDVLGDIGRAATDSAGALKQDARAAFPAFTDQGTTMDFGPLATVKRMGSALKVPLDALGVAASPVTGAIHGLLGSALSYAVPTTGKDFDGPLGIHTYGDPKRAADQIIDSSLLGLSPSDPMGFAGGARAAANTARKEAATTNRAIKTVSERARADGLNPQDVLSSQRAANANGDKLTLMDLGNKNLRGLAGAVYRAPGPAGAELDTFLKGRDAAASDALTGDIQGGVAKGSTYNAVQDLIDTRSKGSRPAYEAAEAVGPVHSDRLQTFLKQPEVQEGLRRGLKLERLNSVAENRPFVDSEYGVTGYKDNNWDEPIFDKVPTVKSLIVANEGLGAKIAELVDPRTGRPTKDGLALKKFRDSYQGEVDNLTGGKYRAARDQWSGPSQSMDAVRDGREHFTRRESNDQIAAEFNKLSPSDKDFYRLGAAESKVDAVENAPDASDKSKRVINSERDRKRFRILFGSDAEAQKFIESVARKRTAFETTQDVKGGSATARRIADDSNENVPLAIEGLKTIGHASGGNLLSAASSAYRLKKDLGLRNNPALNSEIARLLMSHDLPTLPGPTILPLLDLPKRPTPIWPGIAGELISAQGSQRPSRK